MGCLSGLSTWSNTAHAGAILNKGIKETLEITPNEHYYNVTTHSAAMTNFSASVWLNRKHSLCFSHLYLIQTKSDLTTVITSHFEDPELQQETPDIIIFWDNAQFHLNWEENFRAKQFYTGFTDYRLYVGKHGNITNAAVDLKLICILCSTLQTRDKNLQAFDEVNIADVENLYVRWKRQNGNYRTAPIYSDCYDVFDASGHKILGLKEFFYSKLNATVMDTAELEYGVTTSEFTYHDPSTLQEFLLSATPPTVLRFQIVTIAYKGLLQSQCFDALLRPFDSYTWASLGCCVVGVFHITGYFTQHKVSRKTTTAWLALIAPLFNTWLTQVTKLKIISFWAFLILPLGIMYGGELFSALSALNPPEHPKNLLQFLDEETYNKIEVSTEWYSENNYTEDPTRSSLRSEVDRAIQGTLQERRKHFIRLAQKPFPTFCSQVQFLLYPSREDFPIWCNDVKVNTYKPITLVIHSYQQHAIRDTFQGKSSYWLGPFVDLQEFVFSDTIRVDRNHFGNLFLPLLSVLVASGLYGKIAEIEEHSVTDYWFRNDRRPIHAKRDGQSSLAQVFQPMQLYDLEPMIGHICALIAIALNVLLLENRVIQRTILYTKGLIFRSVEYIITKCTICMKFFTKNR